MSRALKIGKTLPDERPFTLPRDAVAQTFAVMGIRRAGKTTSAKVLAEEMCRAQLPWIALDPVGVWWGLRSNTDGSPSDLPIVVLGGKHGDLPIGRDQGRQIARAVIKGNVCAVIDMSGESKTFWRTFLVDFCLELMELDPDQAWHIFIEEAPEFCLTPDTDILTRDGWRRYDQIQGGDLAVAFNLEHEEYRYEPIQRVVVKEHRGELVQMRSRSLDCLMTPDHRAVIRRFQHDPARYKLYPWSFCAGEQLPGNFQVPSGGAPAGEGISGISDQLLRIIGWVITDGYYHHKKKSTNLGLEQSFATVKMGRSIRDEMEGVLSREGGVSQWERPPRSGTNPQGQTFTSAPSTCFYLGEQLSARINEWLGDNLHRIPRIFLEECSESQLRALYLGMMEGDGTSQDGKWRFFYAGLDEGLADDFQELATRLGIRTVKSFVKQNRQWRVSISPKKNHWVRRSDERVPYAGTVWCVTVESGAFVARRNGRVFVTGNCPQKGQTDLTKRTTEAVERLVRLGGNRGYGATIITQRPARVNKDVLSQCENLLVLRTTGKHDRVALAEWLEAQDRPDFKFKGLGTLKSGEGYFWSPQWLDRFERVAVNQSRTYHPGRTRTAGAQKSTRTVRMGDVGEFVDRLRGQLTLAEVAAEEAAPKRRRKAPEGGESAERETARAALREAEGLKAEVENLTAEVSRLREEGARNAEAVERARSVQAALARSREALRPIYEALQGLFDEPEAAGGANGVDPGVYGPWLKKAGQAGCKRLLELLIERPELTRQQLATLSGLSARGGTYAKYLSWLRTNGLIKTEGSTVRLLPV